jgi:hypothetical protein
MGKGVGHSLFPWVRFCAKALSPREISRSISSGLPRGILVKISSPGRKVPHSLSWGIPLAAVILGPMFKNSFRNEKVLRSGRVHPCPELLDCYCDRVRERCRF